MKWREDSAVWQVEIGVESAVESGERVDGVENGERRVESGEWRVWTVKYLRHVVCVSCRA